MSNYLEFPEDDPNETPTPIAAVGAPSTNYEIEINLLTDAAHEPLVGSMLYLTNHLNTGKELALGTVTEITTDNQWYNNPAMRGIIKTRGNLPGMSGDVADTRKATLKIQACYKTLTPESNDWKPSGPNLRMSPATGTPIQKLENKTITELVASEEDLHYLGRMNSNPNVLMPMSIRDFSSSRGAMHAAICGISGAGKTAFAGYYLASQMRHTTHGMIIIDPQGQWASEQGLPFSLQGWAQELGREVTVARISEHLRLDKDADLLGSLIPKTDFFKELGKMAPETKEYAADEVVKYLKTYDGEWEETDSRKLLREILRHLLKPQVLQRIYAGEANRERLWNNIVEVLGELPTLNYKGEIIEETEILDIDPKASELLFKQTLERFTPIHNLFAPNNPAGDPRKSMWGTISKVFETSNYNDQNPAPLLILDLSSGGGDMWVKEMFATEEEQQEALKSLQVLDQDSIKAEILMQTCRTLKNASEAKFRNGETLNTMVVFDEAWRYAPPIKEAATPEIMQLSQDLAGYARDTRKFGIGWTYITQQPRSLNPNIWEQVTIRVIGYGITGPDLAKVGEQLDTQDHLKLYRSFSPPDSTTPNQYPFMLLGPVSPLSFTRAPVFLNAYTNFEEYRVDNNEWISNTRTALGKNVLTGTPTKPNGALKQITRKTRTTNQKTVEEQKNTLRSNAHNGGVPNHAGVGLSNTGDAGSAWSQIEDDDPPF